MDNKPTPGEQSALNGVLRAIRHKKNLAARRRVRYAYLREHKEQRHREIDAALGAYAEDGDAKKLQATLTKWSFDDSTFPKEVTR